MNRNVSKGSGSQQTYDTEGAYGTNEKRLNSMMGMVGKYQTRGAYDYRADQDAQ